MLVCADWKGALRTYIYCLLPVARCNCLRFKRVLISPHILPNSPVRVVFKRGNLRRATWSEHHSIPPSHTFAAHMCDFDSGGLLCGHGASIVAEIYLSNARSTRRHRRKSGTFGYCMYCRRRACRTWLGNSEQSMRYLHNALRLSTTHSSQLPTLHECRRDPCRGVCL